MKQVIAIILLCLGTELTAGERCSAPRASRDEGARIVNVRSSVDRAVVPRVQKVRLPTAWQRALLVEQQIL